MISCKCCQLIIVALNDDMMFCKHKTFTCTCQVVMHLLTYATWRCDNLHSLLILPISLDFGEPCFLRLNLWLVFFKDVNGAESRISGRMYAARTYYNVCMRHAYASAMLYFFVMHMHRN
jgi:hypothetical protein